MMPAYTGPITSKSEPDYDQVLEHLGAWFGTAMHGEIEIGWMNAETGKLNQFKRFDVGDFDEAAEFIVETNMVPGQSVYFRPALVNPDAPKFVTDDDFLAAPGTWADLDDEDAVRNVKNIVSICRPTTVVITGRTPHTRVQFYWKHIEEISDGQTVREINTAIAAKLQGDTSVINPTTLMRVGGTIAWAWKEGRQVEQTSVQTQFKDNRPKDYAIERIQVAFPSHPAPTPATTESTTFDPGSVVVSDVIKQIQAGHQWHNNVVRLIAHWISRGMSDAEILLTAGNLTLPNYTLSDTQREMQAAINGARKKWDIEDPVSVTEDAPSELIPAFISDISETSIPKRRWLYGHHLARKFVSVTLSPGAVGKTSLELTDMVAMATNRNLIGDIPHEGAIKTWALNLEDPHDELLRRVFAICRHFTINPDEIRQTIALHSGRDRRFIIAKDTGNGNIIATPDAEQLAKQIKANDISCVSIDPFVKSHYANENDNKQIDDIISLYGEVAEDTSCAVSLVHHVRKPAPGASSTAGDVNQARGASALGAAVRSARTVTVMTNEEAEAFSVPQERRKWYIRVDDAKANMQPPQEHAVWLERHSVTLDNADMEGPGDNMPALALWTPPDPFDGLSTELVAKILQQIQKGPQDGVRYSHLSRAQAKARSVYLAFDEVLNTDPNANDKDDPQIKKIIATWFKSGLLKKETYYNKEARKEESGLYVDSAKQPGQVDETFI